MDSLEQIRTDILEQLHCPLKDAATNLVFGKGNPHATILIIGEAPGAKEDQAGEPFVGRAGKELDALLGHIGLSVQEVYIANILKYRPPKNANPTVEQMRNHTPYLLRQIDCIKPKIIVTLGNFATKFVLSGFDVSNMKNIDTISKIHGQKHQILIHKKTYLVFPQYHPAALLYNPKLREIVKEDFLNMRSFTIQ
ncbi:MAG: uracil-DNA glycosylase [Candidatus Woesearchaeota archaeon]